MWSVSLKLPYCTVLTLVKMWDGKMPSWWGEQHRHCEGAHLVTNDLLMVGQKEDHLLLDCGWQWVTETTESETIDRVRLTLDAVYSGYVQPPFPREPDMFPPMTLSRSSRTEGSPGPGWLWFSTCLANSCPHPAWDGHHQGWLPSGYWAGRPGAPVWVPRGLLEERAQCQGEISALAFESGIGEGVTNLWGVGEESQPLQCALPRGSLRISRPGEG